MLAPFCFVSDPKGSQLEPKGTRNWDLGGKTSGLGLHLLRENQSLGKRDPQRTCETTAVLGGAPEGCGGASLVQKGGRERHSVCLTPLAFPEPHAWTHASVSFTPICKGGEKTQPVRWAYHCPK